MNSVEQTPDTALTCQGRNIIGVNTLMLRPIQHDQFGYGHSAALSLSGRMESMELTAYCQEVTWHYASGHCPLSQGGLYLLKLSRLSNATIAHLPENAHNAGVTFLGFTNLTEAQWADDF